MNRKLSHVLVIDVGNTNIKIGVYEEDEFLYSWRLAVKTLRTSDEMGIQLINLLSTKNIDVDLIDGIIISSVAPSLNYTVEHMCQYYFNIKPLMVGPGIKTGIDIKYINPKELGADRIVNSVAAYNMYGGPCVIVDFGTATTFNVLSAKGEFLGGLIAPGIKSSLSSLVTNTSKLANVELVMPSKIICKTTESNMQAGTILGFKGLVDYIIKQIKLEYSGDSEEKVKVIATGGLSSLLLEGESDIGIDIVDRYLTLRGLKIIYNLNKKETR